jgi:glycosyltransferase involved in cell wall biosynthesis
MQQPTVTVLIPCNETKFLNDCLASIERQSYNQIEILVVLNGRAIGQLESLKESHTNFKFPIEFIASASLGIVPALNLGLNQAKSEFVARMDSDDLMPPDRILRQVLRLQSDFEIVCVGGQLDFFGLDSFSPHPGYPVKDAEIKHALYRFSPLPHPGVMYRKSSVQNVGLYRDDFPFVEDWDLWFRLSKVGKICNLPETTVEHRIHDDQSTKLFQTVQRDSVRRLSRWILLNSLINQKELVMNSRTTQEQIKIIKVILKLLMWNKSSRHEGIVGLRDLRRALAGHFYILNQTNSYGWIKSLSIRLIIVCIDPKLVKVRLFR